MSALKQRLVEDMKLAMRAKEKDRLLTIRTILAAIKQQEVDTREELDDTDVLAILDKQSKQRRESISQFSSAGRDDLVAQEELELGFIQEYLPEPLSDEEIQSLIKEAIEATEASSMKD
ncbi:MAG TPA: GatB/YqeY domain-containing protein, partial [Leucothrix sp.]|nr:GatB/YqeY domain-containing protein [Leucothrix sp.]